MPFPGATKKDIIAMIEITITIHGPVGMEGAMYEIYAPIIPDIPPNNAARKSITFNRSVQNRAAAAGVMSIAAIRTTPTA